MPTHSFDSYCTGLHDIRLVLSAVRYVQVDPMKTQLEMRNLVLLSNLTYSAAGEILCCNIHHAAMVLGAENLIRFTQQASRLHTHNKSSQIPLCLEFFVPIPQTTHWATQEKNNSQILNAPCTL